MRNADLQKSVSLLSSSPPDWNDIRPAYSIFIKLTVFTGLHLQQVLPENARSLLEETLRTLYSHRITHHIQFKKAQQTFADNMDTWIELQIHVEARRRSEQLEQEITLVKKCIAALQAKTVTPPLQKKIQLLLGTDFKDSKHHLSSQLLVEDSQIKPSSTLTKRKPFPSTPKQRLPAFAFA
jgi:hypothetical protein